ncbi:hypothetical protein EJ04DRAFT_594029 [Polyplosphaeria fusca]|uniref:Deoxyribonuclease NucA/NucB domain-containing protein n=1 Tax=Polyplosphaeria fusca TaxID=682080 RepID=A0A9P4UWA8_9PLEO|nr:hypothetical protein EJ04DRAFT_594029 [Polyplosphaeria fusca]
MFCGGTGDGQNRNIENACNNACYYVNVIRGGDFTATFRTSTDNDKNRKQSGCNIGSNGHSVCTWMPFSQKMHGDGLDQPTCDEFPMADWAQDDWVEGTPRNALRCMENGENGAAGNQWKNFRDGTGTDVGLEGRTCDGPMNDDNTDYTFKMAFNLENVAISEVGYCDPDQDNDQVLDFDEFYMTKFNSPNGANNFPFKPESDNHYNIASGNTNKDVMQCHLDLRRTSGDSYSVDYFNEDNTQIGEGAQQLTNDGDRLLVRPDDTAYAFLAIIRTGQFGTGGTQGSRVDFEYRLNEESDSSAPLIDFSWTTESTGYDDRFQNDSKGYCSVPDIFDGDNGPEQEIQCYFPCAKI